MDRQLSRRGLLGGLAATGAAVAVTWSPLTVTTGRAAPSGAGAILQEATGPHTLPPLPYDYAALEPHIDTQTMTIHHDKHHATYVTNLNKALEGLTDLQGLSAEDLIKNLDQVPEDKRTAVRNNAGGHVNHTMFWEIMGPNGGGEPVGSIATAISDSFGDLTALQEAVNQAGLGRFGSGWAWVVLGEDGKLAVTNTPYQDNPLMDGQPAPILGVDVWEHAYYLKYQNKRADYLTAWWNTVNWEAVNDRYERIRG